MTITGRGWRTVVVLVGLALAGPALSPPAAAQDNRGVQVQKAAPAGAAPGAEAGERRVALVIGNGAYQAVTHLPNPPNDARAVAEVLRGAGFDLVGGKALVDLDRSGTEQAIRAFGQALRGGSIGLFYYAGHGVQIGGANYLVPVSANLATEADVKYELVDVNYVLDEMLHAGNPLNVVILDACRNNPFGGRGLRAVSSGLAQMQAPSGTVISYATQPGNVAADGADGHSPFTQALTVSIRTPGRTVFDVFNDVGVAVKKKTGGVQQPWLATSPIEGQFYFVPPVAAAEPARPAAAPPPPPYPGASADKEALYWQSIKDSDNAAFYQAYLDQFPGGVFAGLARAKLATLGGRAATTPPPPTAPRAPAGASAWQAIVAKPAAAPAKPAAPAPRTFDPETAPFLSEAQKAGLAGYVAADPPKVLAIGEGGHFAWLGKGATDSTAEDLRRRTLERCQFTNRGPCVLYSLDGLLVGTGASVPAPTPVPLRVSGAFDPAAVPFVSQTIRDTKMPDYAGAGLHKALALHPAGAWAFVAKRASAEEAKTEALERCAKQREQGCVIYAVDDAITLGGREAPDRSAKGGRAKGEATAVVGEDE